VVYISAKTPFLSAVKRVERLLALANKRLVQSATTLARQNRKQNSKRGHGARDEDEILAIAEEAEQQRRNNTKNGGVGEEVLLKGTGKAVQKVLELGLWFQQREDQYVVKLTTGSVGAIDDIEVQDDEDQTFQQEGDNDDGDGRVTLGAEEEDRDMEHSTPGPAVDVSTSNAPEPGKTFSPTKGTSKKDQAAVVPESRIRYTSCLEVSVRRR
jgi:ribonuclease P/MRP protein subunit POP7